MEAIFCRDLKAPSVGAREKLRLMFVATLPDGANGVNDVAGFEVTSGGDDGVADGATADFEAFFVNLRTAFGVDGAVGAVAFVQAPVGGGDDGVGVLFGDVAGDEAQSCFSDFGFHGGLVNLV